MQNLIQISHKVQELRGFSLTGNDERTDSHSDYSADPRVVQYFCSVIDKTTNFQFMIEEQPSNLTVAYITP